MDELVPPRARRSLGQNFLVDPNAARALVARCGLTGRDTVVELGAGRGDLTVVLAGVARKVIGLEIDRHLIEWVKRHRRPMPSNVEIRYGDMMEISLKDLWKEVGGPVILVGNLPYNIATQVVFHLLPQTEYLGWAAFMFQREVAERILARPGGKEYGVISVLVSYRLDAERLMDLPPHVFRPRPKVYSTVVRFSPKRAEPEASDYGLFRQVVKAAFQQRRKKLANALGAMPGLGRPVVAGAMERCGIDPSARAERLCLKDFVCLSNELAVKMPKNC